MKTVPLFLILVLFSGCSTLLESGRKVEGWPELAITEHRVGVFTAMAKCQQWSQWWELSFACSHFDLIAKTAEIWCPTEILCATERRYMEGYEHPSEVQRRAVAAMREAEGQHVLAEKK